MKCMIFISILFVQSAIAQTRMDLPSNDSYFIEESLHPHELVKRIGLVCEVSKLYDVPAESILSVIQKQMSFITLEDHLEEFYFSRNPPDETAFRAIFDKTQVQDLARAQRGELNPKRNLLTNKLFASMGPGQMQVYRGMQLMPRIQRVHPEVRATFANVARMIVNMDWAIEFIAAEIQEHAEIYRNMLGVDISRNETALWFLHNGGNALARATARRFRSDISGLEVSEAKSLWAEYLGSCAAK